MRKTLSCVLMMTLILSACGRAEEESPEHLAAAIRAEYLALSGWSSVVELTAEYGEKVFCFTVDAHWKRQGDTVIAVKEPELIAGITARIREGETLLEYDGAGISIGPLDPAGLTPVAAVPLLMECIITGYMARCSWLGQGEGRELTVLCRDPSLGPQEGTEYTLYFDAATHALKRAEVSVGGVVRLTAVLRDFTMELNDDGTSAGPDMG